MSGFMEFTPFRAPSVWQLFLCFLRVSAERLAANNADNSSTFVLGWVKSRELPTMASHPRGKKNTPVR